MRSYGDLKNIADYTVSEMGKQINGIGVLVIVFDKNAPRTNVVMSGNIAGHVAVPMLRALADKTEISKDSLIITPH